MGYDISSVFSGQWRKRCRRQQSDSSWWPQATDRQTDRPLHAEGAFIPDVNMSVATVNASLPGVGNTPPTTYIRVGVELTLSQASDVESYFVVSRSESGWLERMYTTRLPDAAPTQRPHQWSHHQLRSQSDLRSGRIKASRSSTTRN